MSSIPWRVNVLQAASPSTPLSVASPQSQLAPIEYYIVMLSSGDSFHGSEFGAYQQQQAACELVIIVDWPGFDDLNVVS